jgi:hypothetical protein
LLLSSDWLAGLGRARGRPHFPINARLDLPLMRL